MPDGHETFVPRPGRLRLVLRWVVLVFTAAMFMVRRSICER